MISSIISRLVILVFGTLYPAYASYKAVRTKNLKEYVKWMMYWIVFALFTCTETFTDVFLSWFPFYYEVKIVLVLWLLSPATKGSSILYRKFVHPALCRREQEIDEYIAKAKDQGYHTVLNLGTKGVNYATTVIMQTAIKGGGGLVQQLRKSYSLSDLTDEPRDERIADEADDVLTEPRHMRRAIKSGYKRSASEGNSRSPMYFPEVDVDVRSARPNRIDEPDLSHIKSTEDISSGYSSADNSASLARTASIGASGRLRARAVRTTVTTIKRPQAAEDSEVIIEELQDDDSLEYTNMPPLVNFSSALYLSHTDPPFIYQYVEDQVKIIQVLGDYPLSEIKTVSSTRRDQAKSHTKENNNDLYDKNLKEIKATELISNQEKLHKKSNILSNYNNALFPFDTCIDNKELTDTKFGNVLNIANKEKNGIDSSDSSVGDSEDSDDEASFGTPNESPKCKRKYLKGKYGKGKAPSPPITGICGFDTSDAKSHLIDQNKPNDNNKVHKSEHCNETDNVDKNFHVVNSMAEMKIRHKSKSPGRNTKSNGLGITKLLQLPGKLAFWHKTEDSSNMPLNMDNQNSISSAIETNDDFQNCIDQLGSVQITDVDPAKVSNSFSGSDLQNDIKTQNIMEKSEVLQKLIDAKLHNHPEYKNASLGEGIGTVFKSTDV